jgi:hypothetical protein
MDKRMSLAAVWLCLVMMAVMPLSVFAQEPEVGRYAIAQGAVNVRDAIPGLLVSSEILEVVPTGDWVLVRGKRSVVGPTRTDQWLYVTVYRTGTVGWVYNGIPGGPLYFEDARS